jgi:predicted solute-binding protein
MLAKSIRYKYSTHDSTALSSFERYLYLERNRRKERDLINPIDVE